MAQVLQSPRGMPDRLPAETQAWQQLEQAWLGLIKRYAYQEIRLPLIEALELFQRSIGQDTDIVHKEMFQVVDPNGSGLALRPEGTASCVRACINHQLLYHKTPKLWYQGPMFRYERPQKGRLRQFHQIGVESFGIADPSIEAEHILLFWHFLKILNCQDKVRLEVNSLGDKACRAQHQKALITYFEAHYDALDEDCRRRLRTNPLRILDSKNEALQKLIEAAPRLSDYWSPEVQAHHQAWLKFLDDLEIPYQHNTRLVRGLDYYNRSVYEWVSDDLGAQSALCAGGRYDGLVAQLGGDETPGVGFAIGLERLLLLCAEPPSNGDALCLIAMEPSFHGALLQWAHKIRSHWPFFSVLTLFEGSFKSKLKKAHESNATHALILGQKEIDTHSISVKCLRDQTPQVLMDEAALMAFLKQGNADGVV